MFVLPEDDDGSETGGGPPPDPSMREWRHPSEIAAAAAAAARPLKPQPERPLRMLIGTIAGTAIGVVSLVGLALYLVGPNQRGATVAIDDPLEQPAGSLASAIVNPTNQTDETDRSVRAESADNLRADGEEAPENGTGPAATEEADPADVEDHVGTTVPAPTIEAPEEDEINESEPRALLDPALRPATELQIDGVFALNDTVLDRVGGYVTMNGLVFTSASALGGRDRAVLLADGIWAEATVAGIDRITDVAVLEVTETSEDQDFLGVATVAPVDEDEYVLGAPGSEVHLFVPGFGESEILTGMVLSNQKETTAHDGTSIYGGMQTTLVQPDGSPGSAVYNDTGSMVIGMIINSSDYLTTAISIDRVLEVGRSFIERGVPAIEWLGITGTNLETGGVALTEVDAAGPAAASGLQVDDVIVSFNDIEVINLDHLVYLIREAGVDNLVLIAYLRQEQRLEAAATVGTLPVQDSAGS